jgi:WD40-like Beta Propeller Repeat
MTAFDRFDPFERRITEAIDEIAAARPLDYLDDIFRQTARTSQRPRWTFPTRWLPLGPQVSRGLLGRRLPLRPWIVLALLTALVAGSLAWYVGSQLRRPAPFGPAANGSIAYTSAGDIYVRESVTAEPQLLIGGPGVDAFPFFSPNGEFLAFSTTIAGSEYLKVANADGTNVRQVLPDPVISAGAVWRPDSKAIAVDTTIDRIHRLLIVPIDGTQVTRIDLGQLEPMNISWQPPNGDALLFRAINQYGSMDLYTVNANASDLRAFGLPGQSAFGSDWTLSGPAWSPDGQTIAYNAVQLDHTTLITHLRVGLVKRDGTRIAVPGPGDPTVQQAWPAFSPDGRWILLSNWVFKRDSRTAEGWLGIMPADGSTPARDIGPRFAGGEDTGLPKAWSPDGTRVLVLVENTRQVFSIDPTTGDADQLLGATALPDWQRISAE